ncbi:extracellular solute-binding protein [Clostridium sp. KNHs205]|jgi:putative aldouronate transport system substrate-binding protein|uniref:extracellular solute-binding protein n=1 Tax=Clostridium sp. KNHs205 TaxID=1449050 RepID=UPI00051B96B9|nr:extracellular solute-binding protein [Clostridium sp. KNHs205]
MKKIGKRSFSLLLILCLAISALVGCGKNNISDTAGTSTGKSENKGTDTGSTDETPAIDTSKRVDLVFYLMGDPPNDMLAVQDKINEKLLEKVNATVTFKFTSWTDWQTKYNMILSSGEDCDLIYTASWINYASLANSNAFTALDEILPVYAPELYSYIQEDVWNQMKINGNIYSVPSSKKEYTNGGIQYREDLREKYNLPKPDSFENLEAYLTGVKQNDPNQSIMKPSVNTASFSYSFSATLALQAKYSWVKESPTYGLAANYDTPSQLFDYWASDDFRNDMKTMKKWADLGFWSKSVLSDANDSDAFKNGQDICLVSGQNPAKYVGSVNDAEMDPSYKIGYIPFAEINGVAYANHPTGNGTAIPTNSKNPERAAMVLNLLYMDKELNHLIQYGIEGTHYTIDADGLYVDGEKHSEYGGESANSWNLRNPEHALATKNDEQLNVLFTELSGIAAKTKYPDIDIASGFVEDYNDYAAERAALATVMTEYLAPLQAGLVNDVDAAVDEFLKKADEAGLAKIQEAYTKQWVTYCEQYGYK